MPKMVFPPEIEAALRSGKTVVRVSLEPRQFPVPTETPRFRYGLIDGRFFDFDEPCAFEKSKAWRFGGEFGEA